jgi:hypothetical protein
MAAALSTDLSAIALDAIGKSCLLDFENALSWAHWCRAVTLAAQDGDADRLRELIEVESKRSQRAERSASWLEFAVR